MKVLSAMMGSNADLFPSVLKLYAPLGSRVLDMTFGKGVFWRNVPQGGYLLTSNDLIQPADMHEDFRRMSFPDQSFDVVVLDPPYAYSPKSTVKESIAGCYGLNNSVDISNMQKVLELYEGGISEARRLLTKNGILIVKTQDIIQSNRQWWMHCKMMNQPGFLCEDLFVLVQDSIPASDPKWINQAHARKNHSFFVVLRKT